MSDDRTYIRVHDGLDEHPKVEQLSDAAFRTLHRCWYYCSRQLTDGRLTDATWKNRGTAKARRELIDAGLVHLPGYECPHPDCPPAVDRHVQMHDYLEHQRSAAEVAELKRKRAEAGARGGKAKATALASAKQMPKQTASKTVPSTEAEVTTEQQHSVGGASHVSNDARDEPPRCSRHGGLRREDVPDCWACGRLRETWETSRPADDVFERPPWCGECNEFTRLVDSEDDHTPSYRCPTCHPLKHQETA